jgi:DNA repair protein RadD
MNLWPHQKQGVDDVLAALQAGHKRVCLTSPTGGGKTAMIAEIARSFLEAGSRVVLYTNRKILVEQTCRVLLAAGIDHGVRAAGHADERHLPFQVSSLMTENARVLKRNVWKLHDADLALVDEAHAMTGDVAKAILDTHVEEGGAYVGFTATPLDLSGVYEKLIVAGTCSELRACGALVPALHYGPDEPDLKKIGRFQLGVDLTERQQVKAMMVPGIFGRVLEWWRRLNPQGHPGILFAPGVAESLWFAQQFEAAGVKSAHIDGEEVWVGGKFYKTDRVARREVLDGSRSSEIKVLCNRFVLREGVDAPWLRVAILATVFGSLQSYLQAGGRLLRAHPGVDHVTVQDHGGNWWRHGSLNADRDWELGSTSRIEAAIRAERLRTKKDREPCRCPRCGLILSVMKCVCGYEVEARKKTRPVIQANGEERILEGDAFRPRRLTTNPEAAKIWERMYYRARKSGMTFAQAEALFAVENNWGWPPRDLPFMPKNWLEGFKRRVADVSREELIP